jgi:hypothetical protein
VSRPEPGFMEPDKVKLLFAKEPSRPLTILNTDIEKLILSKSESLLL